MQIFAWAICRIFALKHKTLDIGVISSAVGGSRRSKKNATQRWGSIYP